MGRGLAELEAVEGAGGAPLVDVGEVGAGAVGVAVAEELTRVMALVVVIARRAVWSADHAAWSGQQQLDPRRLGGGRRFDGAEPNVGRVPEDRRDGPGEVDDVVRHVGDHVRALRELHEQQVREAMDVDAVQRAHAVSPVLRQGTTVAAGHLEAGPPRVRGADLEAGAVDDAVELVLPAGHYHPGRGDPRHPLAVRVDQVGVRVVEGLQVLVVEAGPLAQLAVPRLELARRVRVPHYRVGAATDLLHLLEVGLLVGGEHRRRAERLRRQRGDPGADPAGDVGPAVLHQVLVRGPAGLVGGEVLQPALLPARGGDPGEPGRVDRVVAPRVDRGRRALEDVQLPGVPGQVRHALDRGGPGTDQAYPLVRELVHYGTGVVTAGVGVIPPAGVERVTAERADSRDAGQLGHAQRAGAQYDELGGQPVAPAGLDDPARPGLVPVQRRHLGVEQHVVVQAEPPADALAASQDLRAAHVLLG